MDDKFIYFIRAGEHVKIGTTKDVDARVRTLQTGSPYPMVLLGAIPGDYTMERQIHQKFHKYLVRGEWFEYSPPIHEFILACQNGTYEMLLLPSPTVLKHSERGTTPISTMLESDPEKLRELGCRFLNTLLSEPGYADTMQGKATINGVILEFDLDYALLSDKISQPKGEPFVTIGDPKS